MDVTGGAAVGALVTAAQRLLVRRRPLLIAIDGRSGSGKSTLAASAARELGAVIVAADDFYAGGNDRDWAAVPVQKRVERVIDWTRLRREALEPLLRGEPAMWHPLEFAPGVGWVGWKEELVRVDPADVIILDGAYSARTELADIVDIAVLVEAAEGTRRERLLAREGSEFIARWHELWDGPESLYFGQPRSSSDFDLVVSGE